MALCIDLGGELHGFFLYSSSFSGIALAHLVIEFVATLGLGLAFVLIRSDMRRIAAEGQADRERLMSIRSDFDRLLTLKFREWGLSRAETDVALLTVRGLKIAEIARLRSAQAGTVKSQLSSIFRKSGYSTRTELVAGLFDELLDLAATPIPAPSQPSVPSGPLP
ncbi:MAG: helix-turn-helix transcriptional regulator [Tabrizicola sp.]